MDVPRDRSTRGWFGRSGGTVNVRTMPSLLEQVAGRDVVAEEVLTGGLADAERMGPVDFLGCTFRDADLAGGVFAGVRFEACTFERVDLSRALLPDAVLDGCTVIGSKALATSWSMMRRPLAPEPCTWRDCQLGLGSFSGLDLTGSRFEGCSLDEADLDEVVLAGAVFEDCSLARARFVRADLRGADLRGARDYVIDARVTRIEAMQVDPVGALGLLAPFGVVVG